ncbi:MAG TPA: protein phosphatase 2C domain-containing protein [Pseudomonadales bacterium]|nr:protein phosphatase 2C domain-containing protein [Pseudomonadales bacterium]
MYEMIWETAALTDEGKRRAHNEDSILARPDDGIFVVADGMGGHAAGDVASKMVTDAVAAMPANGSFPRLVDRFDDTLIDINRQIRAHSDAHFGGKTMGCTVIAMLARRDVGVCMWAGDSRLYQVRDGEMRQISRDHDPLEELVESGALTPEEADDHPDSSVITRAVGGQPDLCLDIIAFKMLPEDVYLLCSDGLYREVLRDEIHQILGNEEPTENTARTLMNLALERGARDNVSVIVVRCHEKQGA